MPADFFWVFFVGDNTIVKIVVVYSIEITMTMDICILEDGDDDERKGKRMTNRSILSLLQSVQPWHWAHTPKSSSAASFPF